MIILRLTSVMTIVGTMVVAHMAAEQGNLMLVVINSVVGMLLATALAWPYIRALFGREQK